MKKVYIGTIVGIIATTLSCIAVFFPSLLNLEKEKINAFKKTIVSKEDSNELYSFMKKEIDNNKIFELDVQICEPKGYNLDNIPAKDKMTVGALNMHEDWTNIVNPLYAHLDGKSIMLYQIASHEDDERIYFYIYPFDEIEVDYGASYYDGSYIEEAGDDSIKVEKICGYNAAAVIYLKGYFFNDKTSVDEGGRESVFDSTYYELKRVSSKELKLKN
jgi:hypothetical protein